MDDDDGGANPGGGFTVRRGNGGVFSLELFVNGDDDSNPGGGFRTTRAGDAAEVDEDDATMGLLLANWNPGGGAFFIVDVVVVVDAVFGVESAADVVEGVLGDAM